jgi:Rrf2 family protein
MSKLVSLSEASSIAIHGMVLIAKNQGNTNVNTIAETMGFSRHHVAKVMQKLVKSGYLKSSRGPSGGFFIIKPLESISLLDIYETIEGKMIDHDCFMEYHTCPFKACLMGDVINDIVLNLKNFMSERTLEYYIKNLY